MNNELIFGAAYYPEYLPFDRIDADLSLMKDAGMNTIRIAESTWSTEEPEDGVFDFSSIDRTLDALARNGMHAIVGTPTYAVPSWLVKKYPAIMVTHRDGQVPYGPRQSMDYLNPDFLRSAERIIRKLIAHTALHPAVIGFQIDNETKHYDNYGPYAQKQFRAYLEQTYHDTDTFNKEFGLAYWSNAISSWDDLPDLRGSINGNLIAEYERFLRLCAAHYLIWQSTIIKEYKTRDQFITHNFDFEWHEPAPGQDCCSYGVQPGINHAQASAAVTLAGCDIYHPSQDELTGAEIAFGGDSTRCLKHTNYLTIETEAQGFKRWTPYPGQLRLQAYAHLASGANGLMYWNWFSIHHSFETYWKGVLSHDLAPNPVYNEAAVIGKEFRVHGADLINLKKKNNTALVVSNESLTALRLFPADRSISYNDVVRWMYDSLYELNIECDIVDVHALNPSDYRMIVTPALYCCSEDMIRQFDAYVKNGGVLVSSFKSFFADEHGGVYADTAPYLLNECFGMKMQLITGTPHLRLRGHDVYRYAELLEPCGAEVIARYEHQYWSAYAGITHHSWGSGTAYYIGALTDKTVLKDVYRAAASVAGIADTIPPLEFPLIVRSGVNSSGSTLHYLFNYACTPLQIPCPYTATDVLTGTTYEKGAPLALRDWDVKILRESAEALQ